MRSSGGRTWVRISWMRCKGSSFACAALGCERAGLVNHEWKGAPRCSAALGAFGVGVDLEAPGGWWECGVVSGMGWVWLFAAVEHV